MGTINATNKETLLTIPLIHKTTLITALALQYILVRTKSDKFKRNNVHDVPIDGI